MAKFHVCKINSHIKCSLVFVRQHPQSYDHPCHNCGSESSTLETDVCVWRYAPLVVHATQEEQEEDAVLGKLAAY